MTKILATADLHGSLPHIDECDILIIAGDVCPMPSALRGLTHADWLKHEFTDWLCKVPAKHIVGIAGNHDYALEKDDQLARSLPWVYLKDELAEVEGVRIYGVPWVPNLPRWAFHKDAAGLKEVWAKLPDKIDILVSHGPPLGYGDFTVPRYGSFHAGDPSMDAAIVLRKPSTVVCGHIHEGYGYYKHLSGADIYNVSHNTANYEPVNPFVEIALDNRP